MAKYISIGNVMVDTVHFPDDRENFDQLGGPSFFGLTGLNVWTDNCMIITNTGIDFPKFYGDWFEENNQSLSGVNYVVDIMSHNNLYYRSDGTFAWQEKDFMTQCEMWERIGVMKVRTEQIEKFTNSGDVKGIYLARNPDQVFWNAFGKIKKRDGFKVMWEIEPNFCTPEYLERITLALKYVDIVSFNLEEASAMFNLIDEDDIIDAIKKLPVDMVLFRVGARGVCVIHDNNHYYIPSAPSDKIIDQTGCGNTSTSSALYAYCEYHDPIMVGVMANVAAAQNIRQYGAIPNCKSVREFCLNQATELYEQYKIK